MTDRENMPPLPEPELSARSFDEEGFYEEPMFSADQLRAYGQACWNAAIEAAAKKCADVPIDHVFTTTIAACASAIRSMKKEENDE